MVSCCNNFMGKSWKCAIFNHFRVTILLKIENKNVLLLLCSTVYVVWTAQPLGSLLCNNAIRPPLFTSRPPSTFWKEKGTPVLVCIVAVVILNNILNRNGLKSSVVYKSVGHKRHKNKHLKHLVWGKRWKSPSTLPQMVSTGWYWLHFQLCSCVGVSSVAQNSWLFSR